MNPEPMSDYFFSLHMLFSGLLSIGTWDTCRWDEHQANLVLLSNEENA